MATLNLTTTFIPPSECLEDIYRYNDNQLVGPMTSTCYPPGWTNTSTTFYSPGICPSGYTTACISANTANTVTETIATCCPANFACAAKNNILGCHSSIIGGQSQLITVMNRDLSSISTTRTEVIGGYMNAYGVQIRFQATDLAQALPTIASTANTLSFTSITTSQSTSNPPNMIANSISSSTSTNTADHPSSSAHSAGAKAGIGVGAALAFAIILSLFWLVWRRRAKRRRGLPTNETDAKGAKDQHSSTKNGVPHSPVEADHREVYEVHGDEHQHEVAGHHQVHRHEVEGGEWR